MWRLASLQAPAPCWATALLWRWRPKAVAAVLAPCLAQTVFSHVANGPRLALGRGYPTCPCGRTLTTSPIPPLGGGGRAGGLWGRQNRMARVTTQRAQHCTIADRPPPQAPQTQGPKQHLRLRTGKPVEKTHRGTPPPTHMHTWVEVCSPHEARRRARGCFVVQEQVSVGRTCERHWDKRRGGHWVARRGRPLAHALEEAPLGAAAGAWPSS